TRSRLARRRNSWSSSLVAGVESMATRMVYHDPPTAQTYATRRRCAVGRRTGGYVGKSPILAPGAVPNPVPRFVRHSSPAVPTDLSRRGYAEILTPRASLGKS